ncbi:MAG: hypothetical protein GX755_06600 [Syntrophomonadaceae bacterium]|nr:hypothetical protein [Syntrophomonadaceae bacterium]
MHVVELLGEDIALTSIFGIVTSFYYCSSSIGSNSQAHQIPGGVSSGGQQRQVVLNRLSIVEANEEYSQYPGDLLLLCIFLLTAHAC